MALSFFFESRKWIEEFDFCHRCRHSFHYFVCNMKMICRTCSRQLDNPAGRNLFQDLGNGLLGKIETLTSLLLKNDEKLPQLMCQQCEQDLQTAIDFRRVCIEVQERFELELVHEMDSQLLKDDDNIGPSNVESETKPGLKKYVVEISSIAQEYEISQTEGEIIYQLHESDLSSLEEMPSIDKDEPNNDMDADKHSCSMCGLRFGSSVELRKHQYHLHDVVPTGRKFDCSHCGKSFPIASRLTKHLRCIGAELTHECLQCGGKFHSQVLLDYHTGRHHKPPQESHACHLCGQTLATRFSLQNHLVRHSGTRPHKCQQCSASFATAAELCSHDRKHTAVRPYACRYECGKDFRYCSARSIHERTHMDDSQRPFRCEYCSKSFVTRGDCRSHQIQHTMSREHSCNICRLRFKLRKHLMAHLKSGGHKNLEAREKALRRYKLGPLSVESKLK